jgi:hypothetical protein
MVSAVKTAVAPHYITIGRTVWNAEGRKMKPEMKFEPNNTFVRGANIVQPRKIPYVRVHIIFLL